MFPFTGLRGVSCVPKSPLRFKLRVKFINGNLDKLGIIESEAGAKDRDFFNVGGCRNTRRCASIRSGWRRVLPSARARRRWRQAGVCPRTLRTMLAEKPRLCWLPFSSCCPVVHNCTCANLHLCTHPIPQRRNLGGGAALRLKLLHRQTFGIRQPIGFVPMKNNRRHWHGQRLRDASRRFFVALAVRGGEIQNGHSGRPQAAGKPRALGYAVESVAFQPERN